MNIPYVYSLVVERKVASEYYVLRKNVRVVDDDHDWDYGWENGPGAVARKPRSVVSKIQNRRGVYVDRSLQMRRL